MYYIVFDIGGTFTKHALMNRSGNIIFKGKFPTPKESLDQLLERMYQIIDAVNAKKLRGISLCLPGVVDSDRGIVYYGGSLPYLHEVNMKQLLKKRYSKIPTTIENDGKAAALAELWLGSVRKSKNAVILVLGTAIGGGLVIDGKLHRGDNYSAGEVSYMVGDPTDEPDVYLRQGFDASAPEMIKDVAIANNLSADTDGEIVFDYINEDNKKSWKIFTAYCRKLACMIVTLQYVLDPHHFIICGGISAQQIVIEQIRNEVNNIYSANPTYSLIPRIEQSQLNNDANLYGALYHFIEEHSEPEMMNAQSEKEKAKDNSEEINTAETSKLPASRKETSTNKTEKLNVKKQENAVMATKES